MPKCSEEESEDIKKMEKVTKVLLVMLAMVVLLHAWDVEGGRLLKEEENVDQPQNFIGPGGLGGIFPSPSPGFSFTGVGFGPNGFCTFPGGCTPTLPTLPGGGVGLKLEENGYLHVHIYDAVFDASWSKRLKARLPMRRAPRLTWSCSGVHGHLTKRPELIGAGDQGYIFGYATDETAQLMPLSHVLTTNLSHVLTTKNGARVTEECENETSLWLRPDGKTHVTVEYANDNGAIWPGMCPNCFVFTWHDETVTNDEIVADLKEHVIKPLVPATWFRSQFSISIHLVVL
ncbi:unnamed protein product [Sphenostylis stenocarpa]|uniref:S-adenosylmethionine synthetase central domain-containing protein n=1 Tax=Sphenostylis stenocarpa TaxID=92480 RepID=A0AA86W3I2_9FABA|nr:unnamed protein product [Sphenostylis stenocarpa]